MTRAAGRGGVAAVAVVGVLLSIVLAWRADVRGLGQAELRLAAEADRVVAAVGSELLRHVEVARAGAVVIEAEGSVTQTRWTSVAERLRIDEDFPALFAFNQMRAAGPEEVDELADRYGVEVRGVDGAAPDGDHAVIVTVHPVDGNEAALGFDVRSNPQARVTLDALTAVEETALTDGLRLVQETEDQVGVVAYQPFAGPDGEIVGWVNAVIRGQDFLDGVIGRSPDVAIVVRDATPDGEVEIGRLPADVVDDDLDASVPAVTREVAVAGQVWHLEAHALPGLLTTTERQSPWFVLLGGLVLTAAIASALRSAGERESRARELAQERTAALSAANDRLRDTNAALERASRAKDDFLAVVSHEFRTPLTIIRGFATTLLEYRSGDLDAATGDALARIDANAERLDALVDDLLLAAKLDSDALEPEPRPVALDEAFERALAELGADRTILTDAAPDARAMIDPEHLDRMLVNLVTNALKYGSDPIEVTARRSTSDVVVEVRDQGDGVPEDLVPHLFDRFAQAESGNARTTQGVGLGLSIVRDLCRVNDAEVAYVAGSPGAVFQLRLRPARVASTEDAAAYARRPAREPVVDAD